MMSRIVTGCLGLLLATLAVAEVPYFAARVETGAIDHELAATWRKSYRAPFADRLGPVRWISPSDPALRPTNGFDADDGVLALKVHASINHDVE